MTGLAREYGEAIYELARDEDLAQLLHEQLNEISERLVEMTQLVGDAMGRATRALLNDMVIGVTDGFARKLEINGVGYRAQKSGKTLTLNLGHSHPIVFEENEDITFDVPDSNTVIVKGADKQKVGQTAAVIRSKRPPEPYLGKGVKYTEERIRRKAGKAGI